MDRKVVAVAVVVSLVALFLTQSNETGQFIEEQPALDVDYEEIKEIEIKEGEILVVDELKEVEA